MSAWFRLKHPTGRSSPSRRAPRVATLDQEKRLPALISQLHSLSQSQTQWMGHSVSQKACQGVLSEHVNRCAIFLRYSLLLSSIVQLHRRLWRHLRFAPHECSEVMDMYSGNNEPWLNEARTKTCLQCSCASWLLRTPIGQTNVGPCDWLEGNLAMHAAVCLPDRQRTRWRRRNCSLE